MGHRFLISRVLLVLVWTARKILSIFLCVGGHYSKSLGRNSFLCALISALVSKVVMKSVLCTVVLRNCLPLHPVNMESTEGTVATYSSPDSNCLILEAFYYEKKNQTVDF